MLLDIFAGGQGGMLHLHMQPFLVPVLSWLTADGWLRLQRASRGLRYSVTRETFREAARGAHALRNVSLHEVLNQTLPTALQCGVDAELHCTVVPPSPKSAAAQNAEACCCAALFAALALGREVDEQQPVTGLTPLMRASEEGLLRLCALLVEHRADVDRVSIGDSTALCMALGACGSLPAGGASYPDVARLLLQDTTAKLCEAFAVAVRRALEDLVFLPLLQLFVTREGRGLPVDIAMVGPDRRQGTALSVALEQWWQDERLEDNRLQVVAALLALRADPARPGPYSSCFGDGCTSSLVGFARAQGRSDAIIAMLSAEQQQVCGRDCILPRHVESVTSTASTALDLPVRTAGVPTQR